MSVNILMSTYNGEKYLPEQLDSLLAQTYKDINIIIRDDGSTDGTVDILKSYEEKYKNITIVKGNNVGYCKSFMKILCECEKADYYAFCDQDDYWHNNKIKNAINKIKRLDNKPALYYSEVNVVDEELRFMYKTLYTGVDSLGSSFNTTPVIGCTCVINNELRNLLLEHGVPDECVSHDTFLYRFCLLFGGKVVHDKESFIDYRQHGGNTVGTSKSIFKKMKIYNKFSKTRYCMSKDFLSIYGNAISKENEDILKKIATVYDDRLKNKISLIFDKRFKAKKIKSDIKFIYDVVFGKI